MIVEGLYNVRILAKSNLLISVNGEKMLCENARFDPLTGNWIIDGECLLNKCSERDEPFDRKLLLERAPEIFLRSLFPSRH